ncbi:Ankyrin repeat domain containing protein [Pandoravirus neocaledonia]|uniref:Ankyrin repeat domain containing protein n=1 Tax=Pandoravirus neocaledonia TaxID=2107708 RepID=A0A2U7UD55_9VIRU|nr:Ankyrin repeat domain containing protein [Pandoravirus neocaledonia]AVK76357.1 Ankyrin repeat domain containing protein [Pandoravirus neocaledonia]
MTTHDEVLPPKVLGLADLPPKMRAAILSYVDEVRDVTALFFAHPNLLVRPLVDEVVDRLGAKVVGQSIAAGAPHAVVLDLGARVGMDDRMWNHAARTLLSQAVRGGRLDTLRWLCVVGEIRDADPLCGGLPARACATSLDITRYASDHCPTYKFIVEDNPTAAAACDGVIASWSEKAKYGARIEALWCYDATTRAMRTEVHVAEALGKAVDTDRGDMVQCLLDHWPARSAGESARRLPKLFKRALRAASISAVEVLHNLLYEQDQSRCSCPMSAGKVAVKCGHINVIEWLSAVGCRAAPVPGLTTAMMALDHGHTAVVQWACVRARERSDLIVPLTVLAKAVKRGHVEALVDVYRLGAIASIPALAAEAAHHDQVRVLKWIAGEEPAGPPLPGWGEPRLARAALTSPNTLTWMMSRPDARQLFTVAVARYALRKYKPHVVFMLHDAGIVPLNQWDAVATCAASYPSDLRTIGHLIARGASVDVEAMRAAIVAGHRGLLDALCSAASLDVVQAAVNAVAGSGQFHEQSARWLMSVPGLCLADVYVDAEASTSADPHCFCARCRPT